MDKKFKILILGSVLFLLAMGVYAQGETEATIAMYALSCLLCRIMQLIYFVIAFIAVIVIMFAGIKWIGSGDDPQARTAAKNQVFHALIGLMVVILAAYLVAWVLQNFFFSEGLQIVNPLTLVLDGCGGTDGVCTQLES